MGHPGTKVEYKDSGPEVTFRHRFRFVRLGEEFFLYWRQIEPWLIERHGPVYSKQAPDSPWSEHVNSESIYFRNEDDALEFKMRWL